MAVQAFIFLYKEWFCVLCSDTKEHASVSRTCPALPDLGLGSEYCKPVVIIKQNVRETKFEVSG